MRLACALAVLALAACSVPATPACPGKSQGDFAFHGSYAAAPADAGWTECSFPSAPPPDGGFGFNATIAFDDTGNGANLCVDRPQAAPLPGTHDGDHVALSASADTTVADCTCAVTVRQDVVGDLLRADGGAATGFTGLLLNVVTPTAGQALDAGPDGGPPCGCVLPCELHYDLTTK